MRVSHTHLLEPINVFGLDEFGDSGLIIGACIEVKPLEQWTVMREFSKGLKRALD